MVKKTTYTIDNQKIELNMIKMNLYLPDLLKMYGM